MKGFFHSSRVQAGPPASLVPRCGACGLLKTCETPKMVPYGQGSKGVLVVGEAPGQTEDEMGRPFVGKAGRFLRDTLGEIGIDLDDHAWTTNALVCRPPGNASPDIKQVSHCHPNLINAIRTYNPRVVVTLGRWALASVLMGYWRDVPTMEPWVGWRIPLEKHWLCPTYHPSYLLRQRNPLMDRQFHDHLERAFAIDRDPPKPDDFKELVRVILDADQVCEALDELRTYEGWLAFDYETNCLKPDYPEAKIFSCAISTEETTFAYPWCGDAVMLTGELLRSKRPRKIASNLKFEERWTLRQFGHGVRNWGWDTMLAAHCLDNRPGICSIKFQALVNLGVPSYNQGIEPYLKSSRGPFNRIHEVDPTALLFYNGMDSYLERKVAAVQRRQMGYED